MHFYRYFELADEGLHLRMYQIVEVLIRKIVICVGQCFKQLKIPV
jgi:hypothetical protein